MSDRPKAEADEKALADRAAQFAADEEARADKRAAGFRRVAVIVKKPQSDPLAKINQTGGAS